MTAIPSSLENSTEPRCTPVKTALILTAWMIPLLTPSVAEAFCGFYVARADTKLFNEASKVVMVRDDDRTVVTMVSDFHGAQKEFAVVVPVPEVLERGQIHVTIYTNAAPLDAYTAPRLVEYHDKDPCALLRYDFDKAGPALQAAPAPTPAGHGVTIEAKYTVGEYDILILSARESTGLETWLHENGYRIPDGASQVLGSYIKGGMKFFVAKVNMEEQSRLGYTFLRPLQMAFESPKFMLPIRLGMVNAKGPQDMVALMLTRSGRVETTNYRTVKLPTGMELPVYVQYEFDDFYRDMFSHQWEKQGRSTVFIEYAWDMGWCDPCAADPLSAAELRELGVFWMEPSDSIAPLPSSSRRTRIRPPQGGARDVFVTRLHVRYEADKFPEDLLFLETGDRTNFQGRYVLRHRWTGSSDCPAAEEYRESLPARLRAEAENLASLTGWNLDDIHKRMGLTGSEATSESRWWQRLWNR